MVEELLQEVRIERVEHVEKVLPRWALASRILVGEVPDEEIVPCELGPQGLDGDLLIVWDLYGRDVSLLDQRLLVCQDLLQEVLVDDRGWWHVELQTTERVR